MNWFPDFKNAKIHCILLDSFSKSSANVQQETRQVNFINSAATAAAAAFEHSFFIIIIIIISRWRLFHSFVVAVSYVS